MRIIKKIIIGIGIIVLLGCIFFAVHYVRINASIDSLTGKEWKSVILYHYDGTEMVLTEEEIEQFHEIFEDVKVTFGVPYVPPEDFKYGCDLHPFYVNGRKLQAVVGGRIIFDELPYTVTEGDYMAEYDHLQAQFAEARGLKYEIIVD